MTPVGYDFALTSLRPAGTAPPPNRRLPLPSTSGKISTLNSSIRRFLHKVWRKSLEPWTRRSGPSLLFSFFSEATASSPSHWLLRQVSFGLAREATYFVTLLKIPAIGSFGSAT